MRLRTKRPAQPRQRTMKKKEVKVKVKVEARLYWNPRRWMAGLTMTRRSVEV